MGSISRMYFNITVDEAYKRFDKHYLRNEYSSVSPRHKEIEFDDELIYNPAIGEFFKPN